MRSHFGACSHYTRRARRERAQTKARIEAAWGAKCFDHAGASEVGRHSFECETPAPAEFISSKVSSLGEVIDPQTGQDSGRGGNGANW